MTTIIFFSGLSIARRWWLIWIDMSGMHVCKHKSYERLNSQIRYDDELNECACLREFLIQLVYCGENATGNMNRALWWMSPFASQARNYVSFISTSQMAVYTFPPLSASCSRTIECGTSRTALQSVLQPSRTFSRY